MVVSTGRVGKRAGTGALRWSEGSAFRRTLVVAGTVAATALAAYTWWPNGDYRPIQKDERGTLQGGIKALSAVPSGRPSLTPQRAQQLHGAPSERKASDSSTGDKPDAKQQTPTTTVPSQSETTPTETETTTTPAATGTETTTTPTTTAPATTDTTTSTTPTDTTTTPTTTDTTTTTTP
jgi:hypothetical protein